MVMLKAISSTMLEVRWEKLNESDSNGNITAYRVCYGIAGVDIMACPKYKVVHGADNLVFSLTGLNEATLYFVAVMAGTVAGFGPIGNVVNNMTFEDGEFHSVHLLFNDLSMPD